MLRKQNGITLIALIITIIVMLILVGVTINVALNGGLFEKAETAANSTTVEAEKEALSMAAIAAWDVKDGVNWGAMQLPDGFTGSNGTYTSTKSRKTYKVDKATAKVTEGGEEVVDEDLAYLKAELETKTFVEIIDQSVSTESNIVLKNKAITVKGYAYDGSPIFMYKGKSFIISIEGDEELDYTSVIAKIDYYIEDSKDYFNIKTDGTSVVILALTENGQQDIEINKKLVIPATILGTDGRTYNVAEVGESAFLSNTDIEQLEFETGIELKKIGKNAFWGCDNLSGEVAIPNGVTTINQYAFGNCTSINRITIPVTVDNLARNVFDGWKSGQTIYMKGRTEAPATQDNYTTGIGWDHDWEPDPRYGVNIVWDN